MNPSYEVLGLGAPFVDQLIHVPEEFLAEIPGKKGGMVVVDFKTLSNIVDKCGVSPVVIPGGSSANTIRGLAQLGHACAMTGKIGNDDFGHKFLTSLTTLGITSRLIPTTIPTGRTVCLITPDGERTMRSFLGSGQGMGPEDLNPAIFSGIKLLHVEGYTLLNGNLTQRAMELAKAAGGKVSLDLGSFEVVEHFKDKIIGLISRYVDVLFGNQNEMQALTQLPPEKACEVLRDICETVVVLRGGDGCIAGRGLKQVHCKAVPVQVIDTTGAGDLFISGFLHGYLNGRPLEDCARYGTVTGAAVVQVRGVHIPTADWHGIKQSFHK